MVNSHYVPMQTLRRFGNKLCVFNVRTGEYFENINIDKLFSEKGFYTSEIEDKLNKRIESQFGNLFANKLMKCEMTVELSRDELYLIKKFLLISIIRSLGNEEFMQKEKHFYEGLQSHWLEFAKEKGVSKEEALKNMPQAPFVEKVIDGESSYDYWMRTLNVILDSDGTPQDILKHPDKTYPAHRWAEVVNNGYVAFWDSNYERDEFIVTDIGMTSENEKGWNGVTVHNKKKTDFLSNLLMNEKDDIMKINIYRNMHMHRNFSENFMMFPISAKRMIVEIDPFYKFRIAFKDRYKMPALDELTEMVNEELFYPNENKYVLPQDGLEGPKYHPDDKYIYKIKKLTSKETRYCNELFLDRINTYVGFSSLNKVVGSLIKYKNSNSYPFIPRVDYTELYELVNERYQANINLATIRKLR